MGFREAVLAYVNANVTQAQLRQYAVANPSAVMASDPSKTREALKDAASTLATKLNVAYLKASGQKSAGPWKFSSIIDNADGTYTILLTYGWPFERDSLYERRYPDGITNIWSLINTGYHASNYVYGVYGSGANKESIRSRLSRPNTGFIQKTIEEFESRYGGKYKVDVLNKTLLGAR